MAEIQSAREISYSSIAGRRDPGEQLGVVGELGGVLEGESGGARPMSGDDERRDLDDLALAAGGRPGVLLRAGDVAVGGVRSPPFAAITASRACSIAFIAVYAGARWARCVMAAGCAEGLTRG